MAEIEEELKSLLMKFKESEEVGLKLIIQITKIMASSPITLRQIDGETMETVTDFSSRVISFCIFILPMGFSRPEYWSRLHFPPSVDHVLSELFIMTYPS